jgi:hypothetical protein
MIGKETNNTMITETRVALLPCHHIYLLGSDDADSDKRFARVFQAAWKGIPTGAKRTLLEHWREGGQELQARCEETAGRALARNELGFPFIELSHDWLSRAAGDLAGCGPEGWELFVHAGAFPLMPDAVATAVIAHELCRILLGAEGREFDIPELEKREVASRIGSWGFDNQAIEEWTRATCSACRVAGVYRCGRCGMRNIPDENAPLRTRSGRVEEVCTECAAAER